jgi:hypothetical protein
LAKAYEAARSGALAFDVLAGARYWHQEADLSLAVAAAVRAGFRPLRFGRLARPMVTGRVGYTIAAGMSSCCAADIGEFGVGSNFSWQAIGAYGFESGAYQGITFSGVIGYRALSVDYAQGEGRQRYEFEMLQHGPLLGISARF